MYLHVVSKSTRLFHLYLFQLAFNYIFLEVIVMLLEKKAENPDLVVLNYVGEQGKNV